MVVSGKFTYDSLTGATPNGSIRSRYPQTFYPPRSVTVAARTCVQAGTLSTLAMLLGPAAETFLKGEKAEAWVLW